MSGEDLLLIVYLNNFAENQKCDNVGSTVILSFLKWNQL